MKMPRGAAFFMSKPVSRILSKPLYKFCFYEGFAFHKNSALFKKALGSHLSRSTVADGLKPPPESGRASLKTSKRGFMLPSELLKELFTKPVAQALPPCGGYTCQAGFPRCCTG